jgi:hypothetical protein
MAPSTSFADLLRSAVTDPGVISSAYRQFHQYSLGNQLLALSQCLARGIQPGPMATFQRWKELGRYVRKGEKALTLCRPVTVTRTTTAADGTDETQPATWFVYKPFWFVLSQTEGRALEAVPTPAWDAAQALQALDVTEIPFDLMDGNVLGFARGRSIAVSPVNPFPWKTRLTRSDMCCSGTPFKARRPTASSRRATSPKSRPRPWRSCAAPRSTCPASSTAAATSKAGGAAATRSRSGRRSAS